MAIRSTLDIAKKKHQLAISTKQRFNQIPLKVMVSTQPNPASQMSHILCEASALDGYLWIGHYASGFRILFLQSLGIAR